MSQAKGISLKKGIVWTYYVWDSNFSMHYVKQSYMVIADVQENKQKKKNSMWPNLAQSKL